MNLLDTRDRRLSAYIISFFLLSICFTFTLFIVVEPVSGDIPFSINKKVNNESVPSNQFTPQIAVDSGGNIYVVWEDDREFNSDIFFAKSMDNGVTWTEKNVKISNSSADQRSPAIAISSIDEIYVVWEDNRNSNSDIYFACSKNFGMNWTDPNIKISNESSGYDQRDPDIALDVMGNIYVVWEDVRNGDWDIYFAMSTDNGATWSNPNIRVGTDTTNASQRNPSLALDLLGNIYVTWQDDRNSDRDIYFTKSENQGAVWYSDKRVNSDTLNQNQRAPTIAVDSTGIISIAWQDNRNSALYGGDIYYANSMDGGGNWTDPNIRVNSDSSSADQQSPSLVIDLDNVIHITWHDFMAGESDIYYANSADYGATWLSPNPRVSDDITDNIQQNPSIATYSNDRVYIVWEDKRANPYADIYFASLEPIPTVDYIILTGSPGGVPLSSIDIPVGGSIIIYASGYNMSTGRYVGLMDVDWSQSPILGSLTDFTGTTTTFTAGLTSGPMVISGTNSIGPLLYDEFTINILPPTVDYIRITDVPNGSPLSGGIVLTNFQEWGNCSAYNYTAGFIGLVDADWSVYGGDSSLLGPSPQTENGIDVGSITGRVWLNASYNGHIYSVRYSVSKWTVDYVNITDVPGGASLPGGNVSVGFIEWGYCSAYNATGGYIDIVDADWTTTGDSSLLLGLEPNVLNGINVGIIPGLVSFKATYISYSYTIQYNVTPPTVDYVQITDIPGGDPIADNIVGVGFEIWGFCSVYNSTTGFIGTAVANWSAEKGDSILLGPTPEITNGINVGSIGATIWFNVSYIGRYNYSIKYNVLPPKVDYIEITATPGGKPLSGGIVPIGFVEWGFCSRFNNSIGHIGTMSGDWTSFGGSSLLLGGNPANTNGIDVGITSTNVWFNVSAGIFTDSVLYIVIPPQVDSIEITDVPGGAPIIGDMVPVGYVRCTNCSAYNASVGYMGPVIANWTVEGKSAFLLGTTPSIKGGINVGITQGIVWLNVSYAGFSDSVQYTVLPPTIDYIDITDVPGSKPLKGGLVPFNFQEWGNCSAFNRTAGFIDVFSANWTAEGGTSNLLWSSPSKLNGIDVGATEVNVWLNASLGFFTDSVTYTVVFAAIDYIDITDIPNGTSWPGGTVPVGKFIWGNCSAYNVTHGYLGVVPADWTAGGGSSSLLNVTPSFSNGINVGLFPVSVWLNASYMTYTDSIQFSVSPPKVDYIVLTNIPNGMPISDKTVFVGFLEWSVCSAYNNTVGFIGTKDAQWTAEGGNSSLLGPSPATSNGINVGIEDGKIWLNASFGGHKYSILYAVNPPTIDYIEITDFQGGKPLTGGVRPTGYQEWGFCSAYNYTVGFMYVVNASWSAFGGSSQLLGPSPSGTNGIDLGFTQETVWFNASFGGDFDSIQYQVIELKLDYIMITDVPNGDVLKGGAVSIGERVWGNCSLYNNSIGYIGLGNAIWIVEGGSASRLSSTQGMMNGLDVGTTLGNVWFNVSYGGFTFSVLFIVHPPSIDSIIIRNGPNNSGDHIGDRAYMVYQEDRFYAAGYNATFGYVKDVAATWVCDDTSIGSVNPQLGTSTTFKAKKVNVNGACVVSATYLGVWDSTGVLLVLEPVIDYIVIRNGPNGTGNILGSMTFHINDHATFYAAGYNASGGFIEDIAEAEWEVENTIGQVKSPGAFTYFTALVYGTGSIKVQYTSNGKILTNTSGAIAVIPITDTMAPKAPSQPVVKVLGTDKIKISWTPNNETDLLGYKIYRKTALDGEWELVATVDKTTNLYTDSNLKPNTRYYYSITAFDDATESNESPYSSMTSATTQPKSEIEEESPMVPILLAVVVIVIVLLLIFLLKRKSSEKSTPFEGAALDYKIKEEEEPAKDVEEKIKEKKPSKSDEGEKKPPVLGDKEIETSKPEEKEREKVKEDKKEPMSFDDEEEPPPPDDE